MGSFLFVEENCSSKWGIWVDHSLIHLPWITTCSHWTPLHWPKEVSLLIMNLAWSSPQVRAWHKTKDGLQPCAQLASFSKIWSNTKENWSKHKLPRRDIPRGLHPKWVANQLSNAHLTHLTLSETIASGSVPAPTSTLVQDTTSQYQLTFKSPFSCLWGLWAGPHTSKTVSLHCKWYCSLLGQKPP